MNKNLWCADCKQCVGIETYNNKNEYFVVECGEEQIHCLKRFYGFIKCGEFESLDNDK